MLPTNLFILHVEPADGGSSRKNLAFSRLPTDVHVCDWIRTGNAVPSARKICLKKYLT